MAFTILSEARIESSAADRSPANRPYSVFWTENVDLQGWTSFVNMDIVGAWGGFLYATLSAADGAFIGPSLPFVPIDALVNDHIFFRLKYDKHEKNLNPTTKGKIQWTTVSDPLFNDDKSIEFDLIPDGRWVFYDLDMNLSSAWVGEINQIRFFPSTDGARNDEFFLNFFEIGTLDFDFSFTNTAAGRAALVKGGSSVAGEIAIVKDVNDKLLVNIDGYGLVQIVLTPQTGKPSAIARDLALQLSRVAIGGYTKAKVRIESGTNLFIIESGTRAADSSVAIGFGEDSAAPTLGLTDITGFFIGTTEGGADPDLSYDPLSAVDLSTSQIISLFDTDNDLPAFTLDPLEPVVEGGRRDFGTTNKRLRTDLYVEGRSTDFRGQTITASGSLDFQGKTLIDINHPFTDDGKIDQVFVNGILDTNGDSKWKIFRPKLNGTLDLVAEGVIGKTTIVENPSGGLVLTTSPGVFVADVSGSDILVKRGDLLGISNASVHVGSTGVDKPNAMYYEIDGDAQGTVTPPTPSGAGEEGLPIYAASNRTKRLAAIDIDLGQRLNIDKITVKGSETVRDLEYNIAAATSSTFNIDTPGTYTICYLINVVLGIRDCFTRQNVAFNTQALNDDIIFANNGISSFGSPGTAGVGGATVDGATYFYMNGDSEFLGVHEFVGLAPQAYEFLRDPLGIDCIFSSVTPRLTKPIGKAVIYFKDKKNQRSFQIETSTQSKGGNGSKAGFQLVPADSISLVRVDTKEIRRLNFISGKESDLSEILLRNPVLLDVVAADGTVNPQKNVDFNLDIGELGGTNLREQATFIDFQWNRFEWNFDTIRTSIFRWYSTFHWSTKISEFQVFAVSETKEALGDNVQVLFSADGETFTSAALVTANETEATYKLGNSPQYMRLVFRPTLDLSINEVQVQFEKDQICIGPEDRLGGSTYVNDARIGSVGEATPIDITNSMSETASLLIDIPSDIESARQLMYFNRFQDADSIEKPDLGPPGSVTFTSDKILREEENVAINAKAYGLINLVSGTEQFLTGNLLTNGDFETGDLTGWDLTITTSGTERFHQPRVMDIETGLDEDTATTFQEGDFCFGFSIDAAIPEHESDFTQITFAIEQSIDVSEYAAEIDEGSVIANFGMRYLTYHTVQDESPVLTILGAPTASGVTVSGGTIIDSSYGSNLLATHKLPQGQNIADQTNEGVAIVTLDAAKATLKPDTRFVKVRIDVDSQGSRTTGFQTREKYLMDSASLSLQLPTISGVAKWYKSWRTGLGDFVETDYAPVHDFVDTDGSTHWYQPWTGATGGIPDVGQSVGFSNAFLADRKKGIQSFQRMTTTNPGILAAKWAEEKDIVGVRLGIQENITANGSAFASCGYPREWDLEVLRTADDLGVEPDVSIGHHYKLVKRLSSTGPFPGPGLNVDLNTGQNDAPFAALLTFLFDAPVRTQGLRIVIREACDFFERNLYTAGAAGFAAFNAATGCPNNTTGPTDFICSIGVGATYFTPLESTSKTSLPLNNVREATTAGNVYAAVDLGRHYSITTDSDLLELIAETLDQDPWDSTDVAFGAADTDDPNLVTWGGSSSFARWLRFETESTAKFEEPSTLLSSNFAPTSPSDDQAIVLQLPQATLNQARVYPSIQTRQTLLGDFNNFWQPLSTVVTDNNNSTFINYSDYPVIALDLGKRYIISNDASVFRKNVDYVAGVPVGGTNDIEYWDPDQSSNVAFAANNAGNVEDPEQAEFLSFGASVPDYALRWLAIKGNSPLLNNSATSDPKEYNFATQGGILFNVAVAPRTALPITVNSNWFSVKKAGLADISTFNFGLGKPFNVVKGIDYGANNENIGDPFNAFDGRFDELDGDVWGVALRDLEFPFNLDPDRAFPHNIFRVFRDTFRNQVEFKAVRAFRVTGYNEKFYPTNIEFQRLKDTAEITAEALASGESWTPIPDAVFTGIDTFQEGRGFTFVLPETVLTRGIRLRVLSSVYVDDSVVTGVSDTGTGDFSALQAISGPQTRLAEFVIFEDNIEDPTISGTLDVNHSLSATMTTNSAVVGHGPSFMHDNDVSTYWQSLNFQDTVQIVLDGSKQISRLEWEKDPNLGAQTGNLSTNAPRDFVLNTVVSGVTTPVLTVNNFVGSSFSATLGGAPASAETFSLQITAVQGQQENASSIQISELRLIEEAVQEVPLVIIEDAAAHHSDSTNSVSTKVRYAAGAEALTAVVVDGMDAGNDSFFSERDFFRFYLYVNDLSLLDTEVGSISLGNNRDVFYKWSLSDLSLQTGWNVIKLQFSEAVDKSPIPFQPGPNFDRNTGESKVDFITADIPITSSVDGVVSQRLIEAPGIRFFELEFKGTGGNEELQLIIDDFRFIRNRFDDTARFDNSLYLNNSEVFLINLEGIDIVTGTVEFWFQPDWDTAARIVKDTYVIPALFRIIRPDGKFLSFFYRPNQGFIGMIFDGAQLLQFVSDVSSYSFNKRATFHIAVVWDNRGKAARGGSSFVIYINGSPVFGSNKAWEAGRSGGATLMFGGEMGQRFAASPHNETALTFTAVPTLPAKNTASVWGLIENLKIYNYAKTDFSDRFDAALDQSQLVTPNSMIEVSLDNSTFEGVGSADLPLVSSGIAPGESVTLYVRTNIPRGLTGDENRDASLIVRWKTPLTDCE